VVPDAISGGPHFADYCERYVRHTKGRWAGRPLVYEDWQREFWWEALEFDPATGLRIYNEVGLGIPRKNTKSTMASAAGLYMLDADGEPEPEVYVAAAARNQAGIVLGQARSMVRRSPRLLDRLMPHRYSIECARNGGIMRSLSSDAALQHGLNPSANIIDELHAHKSAELYTALTTGTGAREQPFTLWISTAGVADEGILAQLFGSMFSGTGELEDRGSLLIYRDRLNGTLIYWYGAPRGADIEDPAVWFAANPISWLHDGKYLRAQFARLKARGALLEWRRYHLNQFVGFEDTWLADAPAAWEQCSDASVPLDAQLPIGVGIFKTTHSDAASIAVAQRQAERIVLRVTIFEPEAATGRVSVEAMRRHLRDLRDAYPLPQARDEKTKAALPGPAIAFDKWSFAESAAELEAEGLNMVDFPQYASTMGPASGTAYELVTTGRLRHDGDVRLAEHVANTQAVITDRGMKIVPERAGAKRHNHGAVAMVMAIAMAMQEPPAPPEPLFYGSFR
jgi:phage terminase large subunit-like protein